MMARKNWPDGAGLEGVATSPLLGSHFVEDWVVSAAVLRMYAV